MLVFFLLSGSFSSCVSCEPAMTAGNEYLDLQLVGTLMPDDASISQRNEPAVEAERKDGVGSQEAVNLEREMMWLVPTRSLDSLYRRH